MNVDRLGIMSGFTYRNRYYYRQKYFFKFFAVGISKAIGLLCSVISIITAGDIVSIVDKALHCFNTDWYLQFITLTRACHLSQMADRNPTFKWTQELVLRGHQRKTRRNRFEL